MSIPPGLEEAFFKIFQFASATAQNRIILHRSSPARRLYSRVALRSYFVQLAPGYDLLSNSRHLAWTAYWVLLPFSSHLGQNGYPGSGFSAFVYLNAPRVKAGLSLILDPPGWVQVDTTFNRDWRGLAWSASLGLLVAVGNTSAGKAVMTSPNGFTWTLRNTPTSNQWEDVAYSPTLNLFVATSRFQHTNGYMTSSDGINWTAHTPPGSALFAVVCWSPTLNLFVVGCNANVTAIYFYSSDGINWTASPTATSLISNKIIWCSGINKFVSLGDDNSSHGFLYSSDGINWFNNGIANVFNFNAVAWSPTIPRITMQSFSPLGHPNGYTSPNALSYTARTFPSTEFASISWSPFYNLFVAFVGNNTNGKSYYSSDGINWTFDSATPSQKTTRSLWVDELGYFVAISRLPVGNLVLLGSPAI